MKCNMLDHGHLSDPNGDTFPCCAFSQLVGNTVVSGVEEVHNSPAMQQLRSELAAGRWPAACSECARAEAVGENSLRSMYNYRTPELANEQGTDIRMMHLRISNKCNFKCVMCSENASHGIMKERQRRGATTHVGDPLVVNEKALEFAFEHAEQLHFIQFTGGESFLMEEHYRLLEHLLAVNPNVRIAYDTNGSATHYRNWAAVDLLRRFNHRPHVNFSIDGLGERAEYIRHGFDYDKWLASWNTFAPHVTMEMNYTVTALSVDLLASSLPQLARDTGQYPYLSLCHKPIGFSFHAVPDEYRQQLRAALNQPWIASNADASNWLQTTERLRYLRQELERRSFEPQALAELRYELDAQEQYRKPNRSWRQLWPQLA